jgi:hypothetical protein
MSIEIDLIKAYFESNGFLVRQAGNHPEERGKKKGTPLPTIAIFNPKRPDNQIDLSFRMFTGDLVGVRSALVSLLGWSNSCFTNACLTSDARLLKFLKGEASAEQLNLNFNPSPALAESGMGDFLRILVIPHFPRNEQKAKLVTESLVSAGVDGVLTLRSIFENLLRQASPAKTFINQDIFHILKLLKAYDLVKEPQLDMFEE